jgi:GTPase
MPLDGAMKVALIHLDIKQSFDVEVVLESQALIAAAAMELCYVSSVQLKTIHSKSLLGLGLVDALQPLLKMLPLDAVIIDHSLEAKHHRYLEQAFCCRVIDRTELILQLFAARATSYEGKLQVSLAQCAFRATRLVRQWTHLERQRGGIGVRGGPGETQLEVDRRLLNQEVRRLRERLDKVRKQRALSRSSRISNATPIVALVGYTNAGKSSVFHKLTGAEVLQDAQVFATLDPLMRRLEIPGFGPVIFIDTVGFIRELPPVLLDAFKATLEEVTTADLLLHVVDVSDSQSQMHQQVTEGLLEEIGVRRTPQLLVYNKIDLCQDQKVQEKWIDTDQGQPKACWISAKRPVSIKILQDLVVRCLAVKRHQYQIVVALTQGSIRAFCYEKGWVESEQLMEKGQGWLLTVSLSEDDRRLLQNKFAALKFKDLESS